MKLQGKKQSVLQQELDAAALSECLRKRCMAYQLEADPLFFGYQRDENTKEEWLEKIEEIKLRYPKL